MPKLKVPDAATVPLIEVGMMTYPDCQMGMVHGITDLFDVAGRFAADHGRRPLRVSHWHLQEGGGFARWYDSHPDEAAGNSPAVLIAPGSLHKLLCRFWATATGEEPESEDVKIAVFTMIGQLVYFRIGREAVMRRLGWQELGPDETRKITNAVATNLKAAIAARRSMP